MTEQLCRLILTKKELNIIDSAVSLLKEKFICHDKTEINELLDKIKNVLR